MERIKISLSYHCRHDRNIKISLLYHGRCRHDKNVFTKCETNITRSIYSFIHSFIILSCVVVCYMPNEPKGRFPCSGTTKNDDETCCRHSGKQNPANATGSVKSHHHRRGLTRRIMKYRSTSQFTTSAPRTSF